MVCGEFRTCEVHCHTCTCIVSLGGLGVGREVDQFFFLGGGGKLGPLGGGGG